MLAASMALTHLASGRDVIMPQLIANTPDLAKFEMAAAAAGAEYCAGSAGRHTRARPMPRNPPPITCPATAG
jgi:hypothetical protein